MKKMILILIIVFIIAGAVYVTKNYNESNANTKISEDQRGLSGVKTKAADFRLKGLDGKELSLSDLKGKNVFINFWATWCPPCRGEMPDIEKLYKDTRDSDLVIVAVDIGESASTVKSFIEQNNYSFKVLLDSDQSVAKLYNISGIPASFFIDKDGNIVSRHTGAMNLEQMQEYVKSLNK